MRNIATCYSEHAVKVSDSYCSGPLNKSYLSPKSTSSIETLVSCTYKVQIPNHKRIYITITWCNKLVCQGFYLKVREKFGSSQSQYQHGFHQLHKVKGSKQLQDSNDCKYIVSVHWDLSGANFEAGPKPIKGFYIIILLDSRFCVMLGDMENDPIVQGIVNGLIFAKVNLVSQCEHFIGQLINQISSNAKFCDSGDDHEIVIKCGPEDDGPRSPVLSVYIDNKRVVRIKRLQWNFRGNQVIFVDGLLVDVMWDVYGWCFDNHRVNGLAQQQSNMVPSSGHGILMFRTRSGFDSRLWLEEEERKLAGKNPDKPEFSLVICASNQKPG